jgi:hypothetical protein
VKAVFADGLKEMIGSIEERLPSDDASAHKCAINLVRCMVGALILSRAGPFADELLNATLSGALRGLT